MANQVVPQVDIGALSLRGLSGFAPLLAALSADNVTPTAMLQMQALGNCFLTSGPYAAKVPDYLRRCTSVRLDRLALSVGWRKGDAASYMADSAGGQAVSLLALCLLSVLSEENAAGTLRDLSLNLLPRDTAVASVSQLLEVGRILRSKLDTLGFGNLLAQQVTRVHDVYNHLGKAMPTSFFDETSAEAVAELLACISRALREGKTLVRIMGSSCMAHILGITLLMFPQDTLVMVENFVICEGLRKSIIVEIGGDSDCRYQVETALGTPPLSLILTAPLEATLLGLTLRATFTWKNWLADFLQIQFFDVGLSCPQQFLTACCNLLVSVPEKIILSFTHPGKASLYCLGQNPQLRMRDCCQSVFGTAPVGPRLDVKTAFSDLVKAMNNATSTFRCKCGGTGCGNLSKGWRRRLFWRNPHCEVGRLWYSIRDVLETGFLSFFVNAGPNAACFRPRVFKSTDCVPVTLCMERELGLEEKENEGISSYQLWRSLFATFSGQMQDSQLIAHGSASCVVFPSTLRTFRTPPDLLSSFDLIEGQLNFEGRYCNKLRSQIVQQGPPGGVDTKFRKGHLVPSNHGEHSELLLTARERMDHIELRATVRVAGKDLPVPLSDVLHSLWLLQNTQPCDHSMSTPLEAGLEEEVETTSVADPYPRQAKVGVVQALCNDEARFLSCRSRNTDHLMGLGYEWGPTILLLNDCCLTCAVRQAIDLKVRMIIV